MAAVKLARDITNISHIAIRTSSSLFNFAKFQMRDPAYLLNSFGRVSNARQFYNQAIMIAGVRSNNLRFAHAKNIHPALHYIPQTIYDLIAIH